MCALLALQNRSGINRRKNPCMKGVVGPDRVLVCCGARFPFLACSCLKLYTILQENLKVPWRDGPHKPHHILVPCFRQQDNRGKCCHWMTASSFQRRGGAACLPVDKNAGISINALHAAGMMGLVHKVEETPSSLSPDLTKPLPTGVSALIKHGTLPCCRPCCGRVCRHLN